MNSSKSAPPRFLADAMMGKLSRWLRLLGFDTLYLSDLSDNKLIHQANRSARILLTGDSALAARPLARSAILLPPIDLDAQLLALANEVELYPWLQPLTRCELCNSPLENETKDRIREKVPPYIWDTTDVFLFCHTCHQVYWQGSHMRGLSSELRRLAQLLKNR